MSASTPVVGFVLFLALLPGGNGKNWSIYYDAEGRPVPLVDTELRENTLRYGWIPCSCQDYTCGCCMGINASFANFSRNACMNFTYLPLDFAIEMNVLMNDESVFKRNVSAKNPPPACMEVPINYLPSMQFCIKIFDIYTPGRNLHMCVDFETRIERAPLLVLQFDCFVMGADGLSNQKPTKKPSSSGASRNETKIGNYTEVVVSLPAQLFPGGTPPEVLGGTTFTPDSSPAEDPENSSVVGSTVYEENEATPVGDVTTTDSLADG